MVDTVGPTAPLGSVVAGTRVDEVEVGLQDKRSRSPTIPYIVAAAAIAVAVAAAVAGDTPAGATAAAVDGDTPAGATAAAVAGVAKCSSKQPQLQPWQKSEDFAIPHIAIPQS